MKTERVKNSSYNVISNVIILLLTTVLTFVTRTIFIRYLGKVMLGLDGLFVNIISMLSLAELGLGTSIHFFLYKPLATGDKKRIGIIMSLLKRVYLIISAIILLVGLIITPFIHFFVNGYSGNQLYIIYFLYLINSVVTYLLSYKESLIIANQKDYKLFWIKLITIILLYGSQIFVLITLRSFIAYLIALIVSNIFRYLSSSIYTQKLYKDIDFNSKEKLDEKTIEEVKTNVKSLMVSRVGDYLLNGTDNIILSAINIVLTGIYSNYLAIVGIMKTFMNVIYNGITASFGNVIAIEESHVKKNVFNISSFVCFVISGFIAVELCFLFNPFIKIWAGKSYVADYWISIVIALNFYFYSQTLTLNNLKNASGSYKADRMVPLIQAAVNLAVSIALGIKMGLGGVVLGTLVSYLTVGMIFRPILLIKKVLNCSSRQYFMMQLKYIITLLIVFIANYLLFKYINLDNSILLIVLKGFIVMVTYFILISIIYFKNKEFKYVIELLKNGFNNFVVKKKKLNTSN